MTEQKYAVYNYTTKNWIKRDFTLTDELSKAAFESLEDAAHRMHTANQNSLEGFRGWVIDAVSPDVVRVYS